MLVGSSGCSGVWPVPIQLIHRRPVKVNSCGTDCAIMTGRITTKHWVCRACCRILRAWRTLQASTLASREVGELAADPTKHVSSTVYYDRFSRNIQAVSHSAFQTQPVGSLSSTASTFAFLHVIGEVPEATERDAAAACEQALILCPAVYFSLEVLAM